MWTLTPGGTRRPKPIEKKTREPKLLPQTPALTTQEEVFLAIQEKEVEIAARSKPPPSPAAVLEMVASSVTRISREVDRIGGEVAEVRLRQDSIERKGKRSFDWIKFWGVLSSSLPMIGMIWGEWLKAHPAAGTTFVGGWAAALFAALNIKKNDKKTEASQ